MNISFFFTRAAFAFLLLSVGSAHAAASESPADLKKRCDALFEKQQTQISKDSYFIQQKIDAARPLLKQRYKQFLDNYNSITKGFTRDYIERIKAYERKTADLKRQERDAYGDEQKLSTFPEQYRQLDAAYSDVSSKFKWDDDDGEINDAIGGDLLLSWENDDLIISKEDGYRGNSSDGVINVSISVSLLSPPPDYLLNADNLSADQVSQALNDTGFANPSPDILADPKSHLNADFTSALTDLNQLQSTQLPDECKALFSQDLCKSGALNAQGVFQFTQVPDGTICMVGDFDPTHPRFCYQGACLTIPEFPDCKAVDPCFKNPGTRSMDAFGGVLTCKFDPMPRGTVCDKAKGLVCHRYSCEAPDAWDVVTQYPGVASQVQTTGLAPQLQCPNQQ